MRTQLILSVAVAAAAGNQPMHDTLPDLARVLGPYIANIEHAAKGQRVIIEEHAYNPSLLPSSSGAVTLDPTLYGRIKSGRYELHQPSPVNLAVQGYFSIQTQAECVPKIELMDYHDQVKYEIGSVKADSNSEMMVRDLKYQTYDTSYVGRWAVGHDTEAFSNVAYIPEKEEVLFQYQVNLVLPETFDNGEKNCEYILESMGLLKKYSEEYYSPITNLRSSETIQPHVKDMI